MEQLHAHKFEAFNLKPFDDLSDDAPLYTIRLNGKESALLQLSHDSETEQVKNSNRDKKNKHSTL